MKKTLAMLVATTALTAAAVGLPAWSTVRAMAGAEARPFAAVLDDAQQALPLVLASNDEDDDEGDDEDDDDDEGDDDDDDDDDCNSNAVCRSGTNPAPAGSVPPPRNGLFGNGAAPQVQVN